MEDLLFFLDQKKSYVVRVTKRSIAAEVGRETFFAHLSSYRYERTLFPISLFPFFASERDSLSAL